MLLLNSNQEVYCYLLFGEDACVLFCIFVCVYVCTCVHTHMHIVNWRIIDSKNWSDSRWKTKHKRISARAIKTSRIIKANQIYLADCIKIIIATESLISLTLVQISQMTSALHNGKTKKAIPDIKLKQSDSDSQLRLIN